jgi:uncharacterized small protein (DUF1192 family)
VSKVGARLRALKTAELVETCAAFRVRVDDDSLAAVTRLAMRELAQRIQLLDEQLARTKVRLRRITSAVAPELVGRKGVWPDTASTILVSVGDNPHRLGNERAFASLAVRTDTSQQRQDNTSSAQSRRRPPTQLGALAHRDRPARYRRRHSRLSNVVLAKAAPRSKPSAASTATSRVKSSRPYP